MIIADLAFLGGNKTENQFSTRPGVKHFLFSKTFQDFSKCFQDFLHFKDFRDFRDYRDF